MPVDASDRPNDRFGYSVYAGVLTAAPRQVAEVAKLREAIKPRRSMLPAHVTVMGTFCDVQSLDEIKRIFAGVARGCRPVEVKFDGTGMHIYPDWASFDVVKRAELVRLHDELTAAVSPHVTDAYGYAEHGYTPHLTLWQECPPEDQTLADRLGRELDLGRGFTARAVDLVGRAGPAHGGRWVTVESFPLGG